MEASLDLLWLPCQREIFPTWPEFADKAAREGIHASLIPAEGDHLWEKVKRHLALHAPPPLIAVMVREVEGLTKDWPEWMIRHAGCPITLVSFKSAKAGPSPRTTDTTLSAP